MELWANGRFVPRITRCHVRRPFNALPTFISAHTSLRMKCRYSCIGSNMHHAEGLYCRICSIRCTNQGAPVIRARSYGRIDPDGVLIATSTLPLNLIMTLRSPRLLRTATSRRLVSQPKDDYSLVPVGSLSINTPHFFLVCS